MIPQAIFRIAPRVPSIGLALAIALLAVAPPAVAQSGNCNGPVDCPSVTFPFGLPPAQTRVNPDAYDVGPGQACFNTAGRILGSVVADLYSGRIHVQETALYSDAPSVEIVSGGDVHSFPVTGTTIHAAGAVCLPGIAESTLITEAAVGIVVGGSVHEYTFPPGVAPLSAAGIGGCIAHRRWNTYTLVVQLSDGTLLSCLGGQFTLFSIPGALTARPDSYSNGQFSGTLCFDSFNGYIITGGVMTTHPLQGMYLSHTPLVGKVQVLTTAGSEEINLAPGADVVPFADCSAPLGPCNTNSTIASNIRLCPEIDAACGTWPPPAGQITCTKPSRSAGIGGGAGHSGVGGPPGSPPSFADKDGSAYAKAYTTLAGTDVDGWNTSQVWNGGSPGTAGTPATAIAFVYEDGDFAIAWAWIDASYNQQRGTLEIDIEANGGVGLVHELGHKSSAIADAKDPLTLLNWDADDDFTVLLRFRSGTQLPMQTRLDTLSRSRIRFTASSDIPGYESLYDGDITATHDGVTPHILATFVSNPGLGLDDTQVVADIQNAFTMNPAGLGFVVPADTVVLDVLIDLPVDGDISVSAEATFEADIFEEGYVGPPPETEPAIGCSDPVLDTDADGDVDLADYGEIQRCRSGEAATGGGYAGELCACLDRDKDRHVDDEDLAVLADCTLGPASPSDPICAPRRYETCTSLVDPLHAQYVAAKYGEMVSEELAYVYVNETEGPRLIDVEEVDEFGTAFDYPWLTLGDGPWGVPSPNGPVRWTALVSAPHFAMEEGTHVAYLRLTDDCATPSEHLRAVVLQIEPESEPPAELIAARGVMEHGLVGEFGIDLLAGPAYECRSPLPYLFEFKFSAPVVPADGLLEAGDEVLLYVDGLSSAGLITSLEQWGNALRVGVSGFPSGACVEIGLENLVDEGNGQPFDGEAYFNVGMLLADTVGDGYVNATDVDSVNMYLGWPVDDGTCRADLNADGVIDGLDADAVNIQLGQELHCQ